MARQGAAKRLLHVPPLVSVTLALSILPSTISWICMWVGASNSPWFVDASLRRPGRFDRVLFVPPPDLKARVEILTLYLKGKPIEAIDYTRVAKLMERFSGADVKAVCDMAADTVIMSAMRTGKVRPIRTEDLLEALKKVRPSTLE